MLLVALCSLFSYVHVYVMPALVQVLKGRSSSGVMTRILFLTSSVVCCAVCTVSILMVSVSSVRAYPMTWSVPEKSAMVKALTLGRSSRANNGSMPTWCFISFLRRKRAEFYLKVSIVCMY